MSRRAPDDVYPGKRIRIAFPGNWSNGMTATVDEVRSWGVVAVVELPEGGEAPIRLSWGEIVRAAS